MCPIYYTHTLCVCLYIYYSPTLRKYPSIVNILRTNLTTNESVHPSSCFKRNSSMVFRFSYSIKIIVEREEISIHESNSLIKRMQWGSWWQSQERTLQKSKDCLNECKGSFVSYLYQIMSLFWLNVKHVNVYIYLLYVNYCKPI